LRSKFVQMNAQYIN